MARGEATGRMSGGVVVLAGGTGAAKLARGMLDVVGSELTVIANTGDDVEIYGAYVSPDPDLCTFWLVDRIDERGWGLHDDTFAVMAGLRELGVDVWLHLGDRDLAIGIERARRLEEGARLTDALAELGTALGSQARVLPMCDEPVRTWVKAWGEWTPFQEFMIRARGEGPVEDLQLRGIDAATAPPEALAAIGAARAIVIGPSNPVISIGPIVAVPGMRDALKDSTAPVVAVSPIVGGGVLKGPTEPFMRWAGLSLDADGIAACYEGLLDGIVADEPCEALPVLRIDTLMSDAQGRRRLAAETLRFAEALA
ncbi:MAG: 2-phospho-L-lactate transferase [Actinomycetota bacterium]|nr:2-phospho-L-lactate transferase [Actinomycetota bacterium]